MRLGLGTDRCAGAGIRRRLASSAAAWILIAIAAPILLQAQINVLTSRYDPQRVGANLAERTLTAASVTAAQFGQLYAYPVDGAIYAQPLYMSAVTINGSLHNVLYVATMSDKLYAFDAESASPTPLWVKDFTNPPSVTAIPITDITAPNLNVLTTVGIQSTPVIDPATGTLYLVARTREDGAYLQRLHALDLATGAERPGSPVVIGGAVDGTSPDSTVGPTGRIITFDPKVQIQRAGLALTNGVVVVCWGAHEDVTPSHGWIMGFDARTLVRVGIAAITPDAYLGGIWQGGRAPTIDADGNAYVATGNGFWDGTRNFGSSLLKFSVSPAGLTLVDYFTPANEARLTMDDDDLSGSGFTLLPGTTLLLGGGKEGVLYLLDSANLGHKVAKDAQIVQKLPGTGGHVMGGPVYWDSPAAGPLVYNWPEDDVLKAYSLIDGRLLTIPYAQGNTVSPGHPGGSLTVSANGSASGTGIVWASMPTSQNALHGPAAGILRAFNAETLNEIWNSEQNAARDRVGTLAKFVPPVVANGRVYLPNQDDAVAVYGLLPATLSVSVAPGGRTIRPGGSDTFQITVGAAAGFSGPVNLGASGQPADTTVSFSPQSLSAPGTATMTVTAPPSAPEGSSFWITVTAASAHAEAASPVVVNVNSTSAGLGSIGVNFVGSSPDRMAPDESAGVVAQSGWNNAVAAARSAPLSLADASGALSGATITWAASNTWMTRIADQPGNRRMMKGYLDSPGPSTTVTVAGLAPRAYDVYVYGDGDNRSYTRAASYTISAPGIAPATVGLTDAANADFAAAFVQASDSKGNYVKFSVTASGFTISATPGAASTATRRAAINGIQIVPVAPAAPPPTSGDPGDPPPGPPPAPPDTPAAALGINFVGTAAAGMAADETAGVILASHWNNAAGATRTSPLALADASGAPSGASLTWSAAATWMTPITDQPGNRRMMKGYLDTTSSSTTSVTVSGLPPRVYDIYVYADGDNRSYTRSAAYTISGPGLTTTTRRLIDAANTNFAAALTLADEGAGNYVKFTIDGAAFTLTATPLAGSNPTLRAPVNGIQIVPAAGTPAPSRSSPAP